MNFIFSANDGWSTTPVSSYKSAILSNIPVGYWRLGEASGTVAVDSSANASPGTFTGSYALAHAGAIFGDSNTAVQFNGTGYVSAPAFPITNKKNLTVSFWINPTANGGGTSYSNASVILYAGDGSSSFEVAYTSDNYILVNGYAQNGYTSTATVPLNQWTHVVLTQIGNTATVYLNGVAQGTGAIAGTSSTLDAGILIGSSNGGISPNGFNGILDEVAVFNFGFTPTQIQTLYFAGFTPANYPLVLDGATDNSYVNLGTGVNNNANFSFETWINPANTAATGKVILSNGQTTNAGLSNETDAGLTLRQSVTSPGKLELFLGETAQASYSQTILSDSPVGYWRLNETSGITAADSSTSGIAGTYNSVTLGIVGLQENDPAASFSGGNVSLPTISIGPSISVETWFYTANNGQTGVMIEKEPGNGEWYLINNSGNLIWYGGASSPSCQTPTPASNVWHHVVATQTGTTCKIYIDGVIATTGTAAAIPNGGGTITIGASGDYGLPYSGLLSQVAFYNSVLSPARVLAHYNAGIYPKTCLTNSSFSNNLWHLISGSFSGNALNLYVDGSKECSINIPSSSYTGSTNPLRLGRDNDNGTANSWAGQIADLRTYGNILNDSNIENNFAATVDRFNFNPRKIPGLEVWFKADSVNNAVDGAVVQTWTDRSGNTNNATQSPNTTPPRYVQNGLNGNPTIRFDGTSDSLQFSELSDIRTIIIVNKWTAADAPYQTIIGDSTSYNFIGSGDSVSLFDTNYSAAAIQSGAAWLNGVSTNPMSLTKNTATFKILSLVTTSGVTANNIASDRNETDRSFYGDIAEILIYNQPLSTSDRQAVEAYLNAKYNLY